MTARAPRLRSRPAPRCTGAASSSLRPPPRRPVAAARAPSSPAQCRRAGAATPHHCDSSAIPAHPRTNQRTHARTRNAVCPRGMAWMAQHLRKKTCVERKLHTCTQSVACVLHGTSTITLSGVAATTIGPRIVGTVAFTNLRDASNGFTVNVDHATPWTATPARQPVIWHIPGAMSSMSNFRSTIQMNK